MPKNTTILMIRHAEKPKAGNDPKLAVPGQERAQAYVAYFQNYAIDSKPVRIDHIFAAKDSTKSHRPKLTVKPLAKALGIRPNHHYEDKDTTRAAAAIAKLDDAQVLVCWHHGKILELAKKLGAPKNTLPPKWPGDVFGWLLQLRFDADGALAVSVVGQKLMYDDYGKEPPAVLTPSTP
jgi:hypothetical protein